MNIEAFTVQMQLLHEREVSLGVERIWQMSCTLPAPLVASFGLLAIGRAMVTRLQRISAPSLSGRITSEGSWVAPQANGSYLAVMMVMQSENAEEVSQERLRLESNKLEDGIRNEIRKRLA